MPPLPSDLRRQLERTVTQAREVAETAAQAALKRRAVDGPAHPHFSDDQKARRVELRARARQAGDKVLPGEGHTTEHLAQEIAYEHWHRMLFARFLAENGALIDPTQDVSVDLDYCDEVAAERGAANGYALAAGFAADMLPQIFRPDDSVRDIDFAPEYRAEMEKLLKALPPAMFTADDSLGWVYQFWQSAETDLLHNTVGAWWAARHPGETPPVELEYLRRRDDGTPAAGTFPGWPARVKDLTLLDPCCGSGHFLTAAFRLLVPLRMHADGLTAAAACDAVLTDNLFGLEIDPRCVQIAAFALALAAWTYPDAGGYRQLPPLNVACSGQPVAGTRAEWQKLANGNSNLRFTLGELYELFTDAPHLGSLLDPRTVLKAERLTGSLEQIRPLLAEALKKYAADVELKAVGVAAQGIAAAADLMTRSYTLVITNVPYLGRGKQGEVLKKHLETHFAIAKADLATAFVMRCLQLCAAGGSTALVTPQNWLFLTSYKKLREQLLERRTWNLVARLGPNAFQDMNFWAATTALEVISADLPSDNWEMAGIDVSGVKDQERKADQLADRDPTPLQVVRQADQLKNPDARIGLTTTDDAVLLRNYCDSPNGSHGGDSMRHRLYIWEVSLPQARWRYLQGTVTEVQLYGGRECVFAWERDGADHFQNPNARIQGQSVWGKTGVVVSLMNRLPVTLYGGELFDIMCTPVVPADPSILPALWLYLSSPDYAAAIRKLDQKVNITNATLVKVPFDLAQWQAAAATKYPSGLPEPHSDDPTQWLFKGDIATSTDPLQVAVARLLGYRWPDQPAGPTAVDDLTDDDGIVCLPALRNEPPAAERVAAVLRAAYADRWTDAVLDQLLAAAGCKPGTTLDGWLRNQFFEQHCKRFHQRPFVWHISDSKKDGFSALVNYHLLTFQTLEKLTYSYLGDWITAQTADAKAGKTDADHRLAAAQALQEKLELILVGEKPHDIFVRWKPLHQQAISWHPDLNDGVRMNIRPFVEAGVLKKGVNIKWNKDRGTEPTRPQVDYPWFWPNGEFTGERVNDVHLSNDEKQAARGKMQAEGGQP
jgi:hypothetical protein